MSGEGLVERLRARNVNRGLGIVRDTLIDEAADALTTAEARIQELEAERDEARREATAWAEKSLAATGGLRVRNRELEAALTELEEANDAVCETRSRETYLSMIDRDNAAEPLLRLDEARDRARRNRTTEKK